MHVEVFAGRPLYARAWTFKVQLPTSPSLSLFRGRPEGVKVKQDAGVGKSRKNQAVWTSPAAPRRGKPGQMRPGPPSRGANSWVQTSHLMLKHSQHRYANSPRNDSFSTPHLLEVVTVHANWCQETLLNNQQEEKLRFITSRKWNKRNRSLQKVQHLLSAAECMNIKSTRNQPQVKNEVIFTVCVGVTQLLLQRGFKAQSSSLFFFLRECNPSLWDGL